jgi:hypothetical protein
VASLTADQYHRMLAHERDQFDAWMRDNDINKQWVREMTFGEGVVELAAFDTRDGKPYLLAQDGTDWNAAPRQHPQDEPHAAEVVTTVALRTPPPPLVQRYLT